MVDNLTTKPPPAERFTASIMFVPIAVMGCQNEASGCRRWGAEIPAISLATPRIAGVYARQDSRQTAQYLQPIFRRLRQPNGGLLCKYLKSNAFYMSVATRTAVVPPVKKGSYGLPGQWMSIRVGNADKGKARICRRAGSNER